MNTARHAACLRGPLGLWSPGPRKQRAALSRRFIGGTFSLSRKGRTYWLSSNMPGTACCTVVAKSSHELRVIHSDAGLADGGGAPRLGEQGVGLVLQMPHGAVTLG